MGIILNTHILMAKGMSKSQFFAHLAEKSGMSKRTLEPSGISWWRPHATRPSPAGRVTLPGARKASEETASRAHGPKPCNRAQIQIPAKTVVKFRVVKAAKDSIL